MNSTTAAQDANNEIIDMTYLRILANRPTFSNLSQPDHQCTDLCHNCPLA